MKQYKIQKNLLGEFELETIEELEIKIDIVDFEKNQIEKRIKDFKSTKNM
jgi:hypothetical protein